jgi:pteridine reductase
MSISRGSRPLALVTGAARRVGLATALELARSGCDLVITYRGSEREAREAARMLEALGSSAQLERIDLSDLSGAEDWARDLAARLPRLDVLVHNASTYRPTPLAELSAAALLESFQIHAAAPALISRWLAPLLAASTQAGGGAIVAMCDIHALGRPRRDYLAYNLGKAALAELVSSLARELAPAVRVNGVAPGAVAFAEDGPDSNPEMQRRYLSRVPLARTGTPEEAARAVRWLALEATYTTGQIIRVDGGRWLT